MKKNNKNKILLIFIIAIEPPINNIIRYIELNNLSM